MGIATILKSKKIILMASGAAKHCAVKAMLKETVDTDVPATVLNLHDDVVLSRKKVIRTPILSRFWCGRCNKADALQR